METNQVELLKKRWVNSLKRWQAEWHELADESGIVPVIGGAHGLILSSREGVTIPADLRFRRRPKEPGSERRRP